MERFERYNKKPRVFTGGAVLPDGSIAELVRDPKDGLCQLLVYAPLEGTARTLSHLNFEDKYYQAIDEPKDWIRAVRLPSRADFSRDPTSLFSTISEFFVPLGQNQADLLAAFVLATWWVDRCATAPSLYLTGEHAEGALSALQMLTRRGVRLTADRSAGSFPELLSPTLLVSTGSREFGRRFLTPNVRRGTPAWRGGRLVHAFAAKAVALADDDRPVPSALNLVADLPLDTTRLENEAEGLQEALLGFRLLHIMNRPVCLQVGSEPLLECLCYGLDSPELRSRTENAYHHQRSAVEAETKGDEESVIVAALLHFAEQEKPLVYMKEVAEFAQRTLEKAGSFLPMSSRRAGSLLRKLGFDTERLSLSGRGIRLTADVRSRIEKLKAVFPGLNQPAMATSELSSDRAPVVAPACDLDLAHLNPVGKATNPHPASS
jgi:hypothetical protein